ncbi:MAG TPA: NfeD family protein [Candidatus Methylomirabilis sp.]|nr:NfeD family protein [Candidatus Methylomirabilis sp.]
MYWWLWLVLGLFLVGCEILTPGGFYVLFFGIGALVVGAMAGLGWGGPTWAQWLLFSVISVASLLVFRPRLLRLARSKERPDPIDTLEGEVATLADDLSPGAVGKAELRGTAWTVINRDERPLARGRRCRVVRVEGLTLWVRGE